MEIFTKQNCKYTIDEVLKALIKEKVNYIHKNIVLFYPKFYKL